MLMGIDLGTSSLKVILFDLEGGVVALEREPLEALQPAAHLAEAEPDAWWEALARILNRLRDQRPQDIERLQGVGLSTIFPALTPMDKDGAALRNAILYCDRRSVEQVEQISARLGPGAFERMTGNQLASGTCTLPGVLWLKENEPEIFGAAHVFGQATTFLIHRLTSEFAVDLTHSSLSGMTRSGTEDTWDAELMALAGLTAERLPRPAPSARVVGEVSASAASLTKLPRGVPVVAGSGDAPLAAFGAGVVEAGQLFCSAGSTDCLIFTGDRPPKNPAFANCRYCLPELWVSIGAMSSAGASVKWWCDNILHCSPEQMTERAGQAAPSLNSPVFLPYLQGERSPWWDPNAQGVFCGLSLSTRREDLCRAVFEGVAFAWRQIITLLEEEYQFRASEVITVGGASANALWNRIKASVLGRPVKALAFTETAALGAALIAGMGVRALPDAAAARAAAQSAQQTRTVEPAPEWTDTYAHLFEAYDQLYPALKDYFALSRGHQH